MPLYTPILILSIGILSIGILSIGMIRTNKSHNTCQYVSFGEKPVC